MNTQELAMAQVTAKIKPETAPAAHTPGPWAVGGSDGGLVIAPEKAGSCAIALLPSKWPTAGNSEANARLMAAAPKLLAALKAAVASGTLPMDEETDAICAIREAEGR